MREKKSRHRLRKYASDSLKNACILFLGRVSTKVVQRIVKFRFLDFCQFLALLGFVNRATVVAQARPSSVCKLRFLRNRCMDPGQILSVAPSPPYLQTILLLLLFSKFSIFEFLQFFFCFR